MSTIYVPAKPGDGVKHSEEALSLLDEVMGHHHGDLAGNEVTVGVLWAVSDSEKPALSHHGYPAAAIVSINALKLRAQGMPDATIAISEAWWKGASDASREALIDHELYHLQVMRDRDGGVKLDDLGRPRLSMRKHDFEIGGFDRILERHGRAAVEAMAMAAQLDKPRQRTLFDLRAAPAEVNGELVGAA